MPDQHFAKMVEVIFKRSNHRPPFAFFALFAWDYIAIFTH